MTSIEFSLADIREAARRFLDAFGDKKCFAFYGAMGAGKTTFIKAVCEALGVQKTVTSPTFALVNEYDAGKNGTVYHFDFYRIRRPEEVFDFGCEEYFASGNYCFVEWAEKAEIVLPQDICKVTVEETAGGWRKIMLLETTENRK
ncbi:MAG: tRNA (adenosine(37)-N6)-threonylcarbamoyltransferase complex ATPase subunit type 1 TsaE [Bacteroidales bacterium]|jgi:tRNA threonylcarbamoyladenosine biosynthesis protein TsaE|nr:tRNA (adenosine(37)-N6)-threonylcarbamoyltransferase complex ATPase subunit type 1 TsaE [Bacteroidales bacterium]